MVHIAILKSAYFPRSLYHTRPAVSNTKKAAATVILRNRSPLMLHIAFFLVKQLLQRLRRCLVRALEQVAVDVRRGAGTRMACPA